MADPRVEALSSTFDTRALILLDDAVRTYAHVLAELGPAHPDLAADAERLDDLRSLLIEAVGSTMNGKVATT